jgi:hypothetical protein
VALAVTLVLLLIVSAAFAAAPAATAPLPQAPLAPLPPVRSVHYHRAPLPALAPSQHQQLVSSTAMEADELQESVCKLLLEDMMVIWSDKHFVLSDTNTLIIDYSQHRTQVIKNYMQRRNLLSGIKSHDTCSIRDAQ